jgi:lipid-A-disaccharide synthase
MAQKHILIVCGEPSGDLHAANLAKAILEINPEIKISGVGGPLLRQAGTEIIYDIKELAVIGLFDVLIKLPRFFLLQKLILKKIKKDKPDAVILVDFSGFNLRLAKKINKSIPVIYYVSPQVWASRPGRVRTIKKYTHKVIVFFGFEKEFYSKYGLEADFVGHPLLDIARPTMDKKEFLNSYGLSESKTTVALLPGSRKAEIKNILPVMLKTCAIIRKNKNNTQFIIAKSPNVDLILYKRQVKGINLEVKIAEGKTYDCLNSADFCLVCSGTATLETAIMQKPFLVVYKMGLLNYLLYRPQVKVPYIGMVNIVAKRKIIPEFIQFRASPDKIADEALKILNNPQELEQMKNNLAQVKSSLGENGAASRAAKIILNFINSI